MDLLKEISYKKPATFLLAVLAVLVPLGGAFLYAYQANLEASKK